MFYFDNASTTFPKPDCVYTSMDTFYRAQGMNAGRGQYKAAAAAAKMIKETRTQIKSLLKCNADYEVVFTSTATEAINTILQGIDYGTVKNVYITPFEHNAVSRTIYFLQKHSAFAIIELAVMRDPLSYDIDLIKRQFEESPPDLIVTTHASNVCGLVTPVEEIALLAKKYKARIIVDMAQTAGLIDINLTNSGIDAAVFAGHKTLYGPFGASGFVVKKDFEFPPLIFGGTGLNSADQDMPLELPEKFEAGTRNVQAIAGLNQAIRWIHDTGIKAIYNKEQDLKQRLIERLSKYRVVNMVGQNEGIGIIACNVKGYGADEVGVVLDRFDIAFRSGLHCAPCAHKFIRTFPAGTVRLSLGYFNSIDDIDALCDAFQYIQENG